MAFTTVDTTSGLAAALAASYNPLYGYGAIPSPVIGPVVHRDEATIAAAISHNHTQIANHHAAQTENHGRHTAVHGHSRQVWQQGLAHTAAADAAAQQYFNEQQQILQQQQAQAQQFFQTVYGTQQTRGTELVQHAQAQFRAQAIAQQQQDAAALQQAHADWQAQYAALGFQPDASLAAPYYANPYFRAF